MKRHVRNSGDEALRALMRSVQADPSNLEAVERLAAALNRSRSKKTYVTKVSLLSDPWRQDTPAIVVKVGHDELLDPDDVVDRMRLVVADYTESDEGQRETDRGDFNWGDAVWIPGEYWIARGLEVVEIVRADTSVMHDELLSARGRVRPSSGCPDDFCLEHALHCDGVRHRLGQCRHLWAQHVNNCVPLARRREIRAERARRGGGGP